MSPLWLLPGLLILLGSVAILALVRGVATEARLLADELGRQREVGTAIRSLHDGLRAVGGPLRARR
jgi:hypothetical protein